MEVPDNWNWDKVWNVPLDEFMQIIDNSLEKGYTISWGTDVSEKGFSRTKGLGIVPEADLEGMQGTEAEKWGKLTQKEKDEALYKFDKPGRERTVTQELRQKGYDNYETTDDHGMADRGHGHRPERNALLQGQELVEHDRSLRRLLVFLAPVRRLQDDDRAGQQKRRSEGHSQENRRQIDRRSPQRQNSPAFASRAVRLSKFKFLSLPKGRFYISRSLMLSPNIIRAVRNHSLILAFILNNFN